MRCLGKREVGHELRTGEDQRGVDLVCDDADLQKQVIIMLGKPEEPRVLGQVKIRKLD